MPAAKKFVYFLRLPNEIQLLIWEHALRPGDETRLGIHYGDNRGGRVRGDTPKALRTAPVPVKQSAYFWDLGMRLATPTSNRIWNQANGLPLQPWGYNPFRVSLDTDPQREDFSLVVRAGRFRRGDMICIPEHSGKLNAIYTNINYSTTMGITPFGNFRPRVPNIGTLMNPYWIQRLQEEPSFQDRGSEGHPFLSALVANVESLGFDEEVHVGRFWVIDHTYTRALNDPAIGRWMKEQSDFIYYDINYEYAAISMQWAPVILNEIPAYDFVQRLSGFVDEDIIADRLAVIVPIKKY